MPMSVASVLTVSCRRGQLLTLQTSARVPEQALIKDNDTVYEQQTQLMWSNFAGCINQNVAVLEQVRGKGFIYFAHIEVS